MGLFGLVYFFVILFYQPNINGTHEHKNYKISPDISNYPFNLKKKFFSKNKMISSYFFLFNTYNFRISKSNVEYTLFYQTAFAILMMSIFYTTTFLPYGRFYNRLGGNVGMLVSYLYIFTYLGTSFLKKN